jgi:hypothetical protein
MIFVVIMAELLGWNLYVDWRNQREYVKEDKPRLMPRDIGKVAARNNYGPVRNTFSFYYRLRMLNGATLVLPPLMAGHRFYMERVSRLRIEVAPAATILDQAEVDRIMPHVNAEAQLEDPTHVVFVLEPGATRYVVAEKSGGGLLLIVPPATLATLQAQR